MGRNEETHSLVQFVRLPMIVLSAMRDFATGLTRGLALFLTERQDVTARTLSPARHGRPQRLK
jgi:hypothetical protein